MKRFVGILTALLITALMGLTASPASADDNNQNLPPVPTDDSLIMIEGDMGRINVLANDTDPDGDELNVCAFKNKPPKKVVYFFEEKDGIIKVVPKQDVTGFSVDVRICDNINPGVWSTLTVTVKPIKKMKKVKLLSPYKARACNPTPYKALFGYGKGMSSLDGFKLIAPETCRKFKLHPHTTQWIKQHGSAVWTAKVDTPQYGFVQVGKGVLRK